MALDKSIFELAVDELLERQQLTKLELRARFKKTKPFRMKEVDPLEVYYEYKQLTPEKMQELISAYGEDDVNQFIYEQEMYGRKLERRR